MVQQKYRIGWTQQTGLTPTVNRALGTQLSNVDECLETLFTEMRRLVISLDALNAEVTELRRLAPPP